MTATLPFLSILMVNWNTRQMTLDCLRSIYAETQTPSFEIILVDNGSSDGSAAAIAAEFPQVRLLAEEVNHGFAKANNMAAKQAQGEYILLLNTDTLVQDRAIERIFAFARSNPSAKIWGGRTVFADGSLNPTSVWSRITPWSATSFALGLAGIFPNSPMFNSEGLGGWRRDSVRQVDIVSGCFFLIERSFWNELGGFDLEFFMYGEEADLCARARAAGARPMMTPDAQIVHFGGASASRFADKIVYVFGARIGLIERQLSGPGRKIARAATITGPALRAAGYALLRRVSQKKKAHAAAEQWSAAWARRHQWLGGPVAATDAAKARLPQPGQG